MSKYVKLEDAIERTDQLYHGDEVEAWLESLPTIDIVHCKDCVHCADDWNGNQPQFTCELGLCGESVYPDDYCSYGEKQVASKLKNPDDSLLTEDSEMDKEQESKLYIPLNQHTVERINRLHKNDCGDYFDEEWLYNELEQIAVIFQLSPETPTNKVDTPTNAPTDLISRQAAIEAMWKALYAYEDLTEKQFMEHEELELEDWFQHRIFVQRMHEECMKSVESLPPVEPPRPKGEWIEYIMQ